MPGTPSPRAGGAIPFSTFMDLALYGQHGFYVAVGGWPAGAATSSRRPRSGRCSAPCSPAASTPSGTARPARPFTVVEAGAGPGTLARADPRCRPACGAGAALRRGRGVRRAAGPPPGRRGVGRRAARPADRRRRARQRAARQPAVPARRARRRLARGVRDDGADGDVRRGAVGAVRPAARRAAAPARTHGARAPLQDAAADWVARGRARPCGAAASWSSTTPGPTTAELAALPWRSWLRTYRGHERGGATSPTRATQDITVDVALDQLPQPDAVRTQAQFLSAAASTSSSTRAAPRGRGRGRARRRCDGDAQPGRRGRRRCSTRPGSAGSPCWSGRAERVHERAE